MKKCVALFAAVLLAGAASAVTVGWSADSITFTRSASGEWLSVALIGGTLDATAVGTAIAGSGWSLSAYGTDHGSVNIDSTSKVTAELWNMRNANFRESVNGNTATGAHGTFSGLSGDLSAGAYTLVFFSANNRSSEYTFANVTLTEKNLTDFEESGIVFSFGDVVMNSKGQIECTIVPEPTALALLALGVAGLALRRRVA